MWFRPTRTAFRRPPGTRGAGPPEPAYAGRGPPLRFRSPSEVHRSTPTPSRRPEGPHVGRCFLSWALVPYDTCGTSDPRFARLPASLRAASGVWVPPSRRPPSSLPTPFGAGASMGFSLQGLLLATIGTPSGAPCPPGVFRVDSPHPHGERADAAAFRASIPSTSSFCHSGSRRTRRADAFLGFTPPERSLSSAFASASVRGGSLRTRWAVQRPSPPASQGIPARGDRLSPLGVAGSPGVLHLSTVTAPRGSGRGAGSWFHLTARARCRRREPI
jgi:hypothetical protein